MNMTITIIYVIGAMILLSDLTLYVEIVLYWPARLATALKITENHGGYNSKLFKNRKNVE